MKREALGMATEMKNPNRSMKTKKRQALSDISNIKLIPTSTLRKLCASSSKLAVGSKPNSNTSPNNYSSEASVASSNFIPLPTPNPIPPVGRDNKAVVYDRRKITNKSKLDATALPFTSSLQETKKTKRIDEHIISSPPTITKDKGKATVEPFKSLSPKTMEDKGKGGVVLSTPVSGNKKKKGNHVQFMSTSPQRAKGQPKAISHESFRSDEKTSEEKFDVLSKHFSSLKDTKGKGKADASIFSCPTLPKTRTNRTEFIGACDVEESPSRTDPNGKRKKRRGKEQITEDSLPQDFINYWREHFKTVDEFKLVEEEVSDSDLE